MSPIAVAAGTGRIGRLVADNIRGDGDERDALAGSEHVDLLPGSGLRQKLEGVDAVIDVANIETTNAKKPISFFGARIEGQQRGDFV